MKINDINHVAIIMDGNGRWAEQHNLPRFSGHKKGLDKIPEVVKELINNKEFESVKSALDDVLDLVISDTDNKQFIQQIQKKPL